MAMTFLLSMYATLLQACCSQAPFTFCLVPFSYLIVVSSFDRIYFTSQCMTGKEKKPEGETLQSESSETDLSVVLNAWYSAGFYTGK